MDNPSYARIRQVGQIGVNKDLSEHEMPENAWTDANNIRFRDGYVEQAYGYVNVYATLPATALHLMPLMIGDDAYYLYATASKIYGVTDAGISGTVTTVHTDLSGATYANVANEITSTLIGGIPIINPGNDVDPPLAWNLNTANNFATLSAWPSSTTCKVMRTYKSYLVALDITKSGVNFPYMVKWSHPADPGATPISWDHTDATKDAGETDLAEGYDQLVDGLQLKDSFMIYKTNSVWRMDFTGGPYVMRFSKVLGVSGAMNRNCVVEVDGFHFVLADSDVIVHDGYTATSVLDKQTRYELFASIDSENRNKCFVVKNTYFNEVMVCYPFDSTSCNKALIWNYKDKTVSFRDLPSLNHAAFGPAGSQLVTTWNDDLSSWAADLTTWSQQAVATKFSSIIGASSDGKLYLFDYSADADGTSISSYVERRAMSLGMPETTKLIRGVRARILGNKGETVTVKVGYSDDPYSDPVYSSHTHVIGETVSDNLFACGRYIAVRFESGTAKQWRLDSYDLDLTTRGKW